MAEKYIDLYERITEHARTTNDFRHGAIAVLEFLDRNPDQVPGRTITESEAKPLRGIMVRRDGYPALKIEDYLRITVVPDPEPTNAERWREFLSERLSVGLKPWQLGYLVRAMDERGVKAPGGDDAESREASKARSDAGWEINIDRQGGA